MKLDDLQCLPISVLKGALVTNPNGGEFYIKGVSVDIANHAIYIELVGERESFSVEWSTIEDWAIQFQGGT